MSYEVLRTTGPTRDPEQIFDFLVTAAENLGESPERAFARAQERLLEIEAAMEGLGREPHHGMLRAHLCAQVRNATKGRAVLYFETDATAARSLSSRSFSAARTTRGGFCCGF